VYQHVHGVREVPGPEFLYNPVHNINLGVAYLNLLDTHYLKEIEDPQSRLYAIVAAYNTGVGSLAHAFPVAPDKTAGLKLDAV